MNQQAERARSIPARWWRMDSALADRISRDRFTCQYQRWVKVGVVAAVAGYSASSTAIVAEHSTAALWTRTDPWALMASLVCAWVLYRGHSRAASVMLLITVVIELHANLLLAPSEWMAIAAVLPVVNLATTLFLGLRVGLLTAAGLLLTIPGAMHLSGLLGYSRGFATPGAISFVVSLGAMLFSSNALLLALLRTLAALLEQNRVSEHRSSVLVDRSPDAMLAVTANGTLDALNRAAEQLLGVPHDQAQGKPLASLSLHCENLGTSELLDALLSDGAARQLSAGSPPTQVEALARPLLRPDGRDGALIVLRDISARVEAEERARQLQVQLQYAQKLEAVGMLASGVAHDFNNLLTAVAGYGSLLTNSPDPEAREYSEVILDVQRQGSALVKKLLQFTRQQPMAPRPTDLSAAVEHIAPLLQRLLGERHSLVIDGQAHCQTLMDPGRVEELLLSLTANAQEYLLDDDPVHLRCGRENGKVFLEVTTPHGPQCMDPRANPTSQKFKALGLATVERIVQDAGGHLEVSSSEAGGTRCAAYLPALADSVAANPALGAAMWQPSARPLRAMLAEDNRWVRKSVQQVLSRFGFEVTAVSNGTEAIEQLSKAEQPPDLLFCDVVLPGATGPEVVREAQKRWPRVKYLYMSGYTGSALQPPSLRDCPYLLPKPFTNEQLLERISWRLGETAGAAAPPPAAPRVPPLH